MLEEPDPAAALAPQLTPASSHNKQQAKSQPSSARHAALQQTPEPHNRTQGSPLEALDRMDSAVVGLSSLPAGGLLRAAFVPGPPACPGLGAEPLPGIALGLEAALLGSTAERCTGSPTGEQAAGPGSPGQGLYSAVLPQALPGCLLRCLTCCEACMLGQVWALMAVRAPPLQAGDGVDRVDSVAGIQMCSGRKQVFSVSDMV